MEYNYHVLPQQENCPKCKSSTFRQEQVMLKSTKRRKFEIALFAMFMIIALPIISMIFRGILDFNNRDHLIQIAITLGFLYIILISAYSRIDFESKPHTRKICNACNTQF